MATRGEGRFVELSMSSTVDRRDCLVRYSIGDTRLGRWEEQSAFSQVRGMLLKILNTKLVEPVGYVLLQARWSPSMVPVALSTHQVIGTEAPPDRRRR